MKNVFAIEHNKDSDDYTQYDGACFISNQISDEQKDNLDKISEETKVMMKKSGVSIIKILPQYILLFFGILIFIEEVSVKFERGVSFSQIVSEHPLLNLIACAMLLASLIIFRIRKIKRDKYLESQEFQDYMEKSEDVSMEAMRELGIPEDCASVNVLSFEYKTKKGKTVRANRYDFMPIDMFVYTDSEHLYLADCSTVFTFDKSNILRIENIDKKVTMALWLKDEELKNEKYKPYKMSETNDYNILMRNYYSLQISSSNDTGVYEILFPPYEIDRIASMLGMTVTDRPY